MTNITELCLCLLSLSVSPEICLLLFPEKHILAVLVAVRLLEAQEGALSLEQRPLNSWGIYGACWVSVLSREVICDDVATERDSRRPQ